MKAIIIVLCILLNFQSSHAAQICNDYITDEWPDSRYKTETLSGGNVVTDYKTRLMWKQCSEGLSGFACMTGTISTHNWQEALNIPHDVNSNSGFAGFNDWRLPNIKELRSISAINCVSPSINESVFPNTQNNYYWSSSPFVGSHQDALSFSYVSGSDESNDRNSNHAVRLVRSVEQ